MNAFAVFEKLPNMAQGVIVFDQPSNKIYIHLQLPVNIQKKIFTICDILVGKNLISLNIPFASIGCLDTVLERSHFFNYGDCITLFGRSTSMPHIMIGHTFLGRRNIYLGQGAP